MAAGRAVAVAAMVAVVAAAAAALPRLADGAYQDCYNYCFNDCVSKDKSMRDYCSYACDKTCAPDAALRRRPVAGLPINCQLACVRESCHRRRAGNLCAMSLHTPFDRFGSEFSLSTHVLFTCAITA